jgi:hypothetical protein
MITSVGDSQEKKHRDPAQMNANHAHVRMPMRGMRMHMF